MSNQTSRRNSFITLILAGVFFLTACSSAASTPAQPTVAATAGTPDWFKIELTDARTGQPFTINDFAGKVVLVETMAMWCPNCIVQAAEVRTLHELLGNPADLVSVSLDVDVHEDQAALKGYVEEWGFDWHFAVAPLGVARALGNLYSAQYLNPPLRPMLIIDRSGNVHQLEYGQKDAETLRQRVEPYLTAQ